LTPTSSPIKSPSRIQQKWALTSIIIASKVRAKEATIRKVSDDVQMHNPYHQLSLQDLQPFLKLSAKELIESEKVLLMLIGYSANMRGGVLLRSVHFALTHYGESFLVLEGDKIQLNTIGTMIVEQVLVEKRVLALRTSELIAGICLCAALMWKQNGLCMSSADLEWGKEAPPKGQHNLTKNQFI
jgi:hypothetical protein